MHFNQYRCYFILALMVLSYPHLHADDLFDALKTYKNQQHFVLEDFQPAHYPYRYQGCIAGVKGTQFIIKSDDGSVGMLSLKETYKDITLLRYLKDSDSLEVKSSTSGVCYTLKLNRYTSIPNRFTATLRDKRSNQTYPVSDQQLEIPQKATVVPVQNSTVFYIVEHEPDKNPLAYKALEL